MEKSGNIKVIEPEDNFKKISKLLINNGNIDCATLGLYTKVVCLGTTWKLNIKGLSTKLGLSDTKVRKAVSILEKEGYVTRHAVKDDNGKFVGWDYHFHAESISEEQRTAAGKRTSQKTDTPQNGQHRKRTTPKTDNTENGEENNKRPNQIEDLNNRETESSKENNKKKFDFRSAILSLGVEENICDDWLQVRKAKKASNTETAFKAINNQILISGLPANECIRIAAENSWQGFKAEWLVNLNISNNGQANNTTDNAERAKRFGGYAEVYQKFANMSDDEESKRRASVKRFL